MVYITRRENFNAAHRLFNPKWSDEKNEQVFGRCANSNYHGHNFHLWVTVKGQPDPETGFVIDLKYLGDVLKRSIVDRVDHKNLNLDVDFLKNQLPSIENIVIAFWKIIKLELSDLPCELHKIKLVETENNFVEYFGE